MRFFYPIVIMLMRTLYERKPFNSKRTLIVLSILIHAICALKPNSLRILCHRAHCQGKLGRVFWKSIERRWTSGWNRSKVCTYISCLVCGNIHRDIGYLDIWIWRGKISLKPFILYDPELAKAYLNPSFFIRYLQKDYWNALSDVNHALDIDDHLVAAYSTRCSINAALNQWESALMNIHILLDRVWEPAIREKLHVRKRLMERKASSLDWLTL